MTPIFGSIIQSHVRRNRCIYRAKTLRYCSSSTGPPDPVLIQHTDNQGKNTVECVHSSRQPPAHFSNACCRDLLFPPPECNTLSIVIGHAGDHCMTATMDYPLSTLTGQYSAIFIHSTDSSLNTTFSRYVDPTTIIVPSNDYNIKGSPIGRESNPTVACGLTLRFASHKPASVSGRCLGRRAPDTSKPRHQRRRSSPTRPATVPCCETRKSNPTCFQHDGTICYTFSWISDGSFGTSKNITNQKQCSRVA